MVDHPHHSTVSVAPRADTQTTRAKPIEFSQALADHICTQLANGRSLRSICQDDDMPAVGSVFRWINANPEFRERYARARDMQADALAEEIVDIADTDPDPQRARNRIDARKWYAAKTAPKKYGDHIDVTHSAGGDKRVGIVIDLRPEPEPLPGDDAKLIGQD